MGLSLACGVRASADAPGWVIALADMPYILPATIAALVRCLRRGAALAHFALYATLVLLPITGLTAIFVADAAGGVHALLTSILLALVALHVLAAFYHLIVLRDGVFRRIFVAR